MISSWLFTGLNYHEVHVYSSTTQVWNQPYHRHGGYPDEHARVEGLSKNSAAHNLASYNLDSSSPSADGFVGEEFSSESLSVQHTQFSIPGDDSVISSELLNDRIHRFAK